MRLLSSANPETVEQWQASYRHSLALLLVIWLISPGPNVTSSTPSEISSVVKPTPSDGAQQSPKPDVITLASISASPPSESPLTPAFSVGAAATESYNESTDTTTMPVKGSTTRDGNSSNNWTATPPISQPPPPPKRSAEPAIESQEALVVERAPVESHEAVFDRRVAAEGSIDESSTPPAFSPPRSELADAFEEFSLFLFSTLHLLFMSIAAWRPSSLHLFGLVLNLLAGVQLVILMAEDSIIRTSMADPMPKDLPRGSSWGKRVTRWNWRMGQLGQRFVGAMTAVAGSAVLLGWVAWEVSQSGEEKGWDDVPGARWLPGHAMVRAGHSPGAVPSPLRMLVGMQTLVTALSLVQPIKHLLTHSVLPPTLPPPAFLLAHAPATGATRPPLALESPYLVSVLLSLAQSFITLFGLSLLLFNILPTTRWTLITFLLKPAGHILFHLISAKLRDIRKVRDGFRKTCACLEVVSQVFCEQGAAEEDVDWVCTICFEGMEEGAPGSVAAESAATTVKARCRLPCAHRFHAGCLSTWLQYQSWCPSCHQKIAPEPRPAVVEDLSDLYPGARAAELRRAAQLLAQLSE